MIEITQKKQNIKNIIKILLTVSFHSYNFFDVKWIFFHYYIIFHHFFESLEYKLIIDL